MDKVLIDTDVILDFFFDREPFSKNAALIFTFCETKKIRGFVTPVICSNVYYLLRRTTRHQKVIEKLSQLMTVMDVLTVDKDIVIQALGSGFKDFEDALQNFTAIRAGFISVIITRNTKDFVESDIGVLSPENYVKTLTASR